jgi:transcriptional regulator with XRE-family HTH domain
MTSTEVAVIETETGEVEPLTEKGAKALDKRIRQASTRFANEGDKLKELLETALNGEIHKALGFPSWTAYVKDAVDFVPAGREDRRELVKLMSGKGMSQRAIAGALNVSQKTVDRDLEGETFDTDTVTTLDNKTAPRTKAKKQKAKDDNVIDVEVVSVEEDRKPADMIEDFQQPLYDMINDIQAVKDLITLEPDLFARSRKRIAGRFGNRFQTALTDLKKVVEQITAE